MASSRNNNILHSISKVSALISIRKHDYDEDSANPSFARKRHISIFANIFNLDEAIIYRLLSYTSFEEFESDINTIKSSYMEDNPRITNDDKLRKHMYTAYYNAYHSTKEYLKTRRQT